MDIERHGTKHVLIRIIDLWICLLDEHIFVGTGLMDHSKAFDCIPYGLFCFLNYYAPGCQANWCNMTFTASNIFPSHTCIGVI